MAESVHPSPNGVAKLKGMAEKVRKAISHSHNYFRDAPASGRLLVGELESNPTMEAEYLMLSHFLERRTRTAGGKWPITS